MNKEQLETNMAALKLLQSETNDKVRDYQNQIAELEKQIEDINKPELTPKQLDDIQEAVEKALENYSFSDCDNYEVDFSLDYDGRVQLESIDLSCSYELTEMIVDKVHNLFKEADCPEELDTTEVDNHKPV
jgi:heme-binding NEAT domain protein